MIWLKWNLKYFPKSIKPELVSFQRTFIAINNTLLFSIRNSKHQSTCNHEIRDLKTFNFLAWSCISRKEILPESRISVQTRNRGLTCLRPVVPPLMWHYHVKSILNITSSQRSSAICWSTLWHMCTHAAASLWVNSSNNYFCTKTEMAMCLGRTTPVTNRLIRRD